MIRLLCILFPPVISLVLRNHRRKAEKSITDIFIEYGIWVAVINLITIMIFSIYYRCGIADVVAMQLGGYFPLKYILLSLFLSIVLAYLFCEIKLTIVIAPTLKITPSTMRIANIVKNVIVAVILFVAFLLLFSMDWILNNFGLLTPEKLIFQLKVPLKGTNTSFIRSFILASLLPSVLLASIFIFLINFRTDKEYLIKVNAFKRFDFIISPLKYVRRFSALISVILLVISTASFTMKMDLSSYLTNATKNSEFIEENFTDVKSINISFPEKKRNLIYIFMESFENTYLSAELGGAHSVNLIPELTELAMDNISFSHNDKLGGAFQMPDTGWTIAAMVSQTAGIPLKIPVLGNSYGDYSSFLPGAVTLGDILRPHGYNQTLLVGSDAEFGGRKDYFQQHGEFNILDYFTAEKDGIIPTGYKVWWGFEDKYLYKYAKKEILRLAGESEPFNITLLTVDTHHIGGYKCSLCKNEYENQFSNVIACASRQATDFIKWIQEQEFYENTTIVVAGDHLSMDPEYFKNLDNYARTTLNAFINSAVSTDNTKNRSFATFDMLPTVLASMGAEIKGERLALGTNLFSGKPTLIEEFGIDNVKNELSKNSGFYNKKILYLD